MGCGGPFWDWIGGSSIVGDTIIRRVPRFVSPFLGDRERPPKENPEHAAPGLSPCVEVALPHRDDHFLRPVLIVQGGAGFLLSLAGQKFHPGSAGLA